MDLMDSFAKPCGQRSIFSTGGQVPTTMVAPALANSYFQTRNQQLQTDKPAPRSSLQDRGARAIAQPYPLVSATPGDKSTRGQMNAGSWKAAPSNRVLRQLGTHGNSNFQEYVDCRAQVSVCTTVTPGTASCKRGNASSEINLPLEKNAHYRADCC